MSRAPRNAPRGSRVRVATEAERALWEAVNRDTVPLAATTRIRHTEAAASAPKPVVPAPPVADRTRIHASAPEAGRAWYTPADASIEPLRDRTPGLDRNTARALRRGQREPEMRIDLHGMTANRAHEALIGFIRRARAAGMRCVLVITGKGGAYAERASGANFGEGVLRREVPHWLRSAPLSGAVVGIYQAHQRHGGEGALYVYLRKPRG